MIRLLAPMGQLESMQRDVTPMDAAISISEGFARNVISASLTDNRLKTTL
jgi:threonyl-tRNA synthetase